MDAWHCDGTPTPVGLPVRMNGSEQSYELGLFDGSTHSDQYADEPEAGVLFESPEGAREWLEAVKAVLTPYIESGDRTVRVPDSSGWAEVD